MLFKLMRLTLHGLINAEGRTSSPIKTEVFENELFQWEVSGNLMVCLIDTYQQLGYDELTLREIMVTRQQGNL